MKPNIRKDLEKITEILDDFGVKILRARPMSGDVDQAHEEALDALIKVVEGAVPSKRNGDRDPQTGAPVGMQGCVDHGYDQCIDAFNKALNKEEISQ